MPRSWGIIQVYQYSREASAENSEDVNYSFSLSHVREACADVHTHIDIFRGMYTNLRTCHLLVRMPRSWGKIQVYQYSRETCAENSKHVNYSFSLSHVREACADVHTHIDIFRGMYTSLRTCDLLVRMPRSWGKIQVYQYSREACAENSKHVNYSFLPSHVQEACADVRMHIDI